jgi:hypothetical protein
MRYQEQAKKRRGQEQAEKMKDRLLFVSTLGCYAITVLRISVAAKSARQF